MKQRRSGIVIIMILLMLVLIVYTASSLSRMNARIEEAELAKEALADEALALLERLRPEMCGPMLFFLDAADMPEPAGNHFASQFKRAAARAGLPGLTLYSLRHIAASYLVMSRVDIATVREILGHRSITTTMRYTHINDAHRIEAIRALDKFGR